MNKVTHAPGNGPLERRVALVGGSKEACRFPTERSKTGAVPQGCRFRQASLSPERDQLRQVGMDKLCAHFCSSLPIASLRPVA